MFYDLTAKNPRPNWPETRYGVNARLIRDDSAVKIPVLPGVNILIVGVPGNGKTVLTKEIAQGLFEEDPELYAVFFQIKPDDFTAAFLRPQDKVISYSPGVCPEGNLFKWCMVKEVRCCDRSKWDAVLNEITTILFSDLLQDKRNLVWIDGAMTTFKAFLKVILYKYRNNPPNYKVINAMKTMPRKELLRFLAEYPPNRSMLMDNFEYDPDHCENYTMPRKGSDILFFLQNVLDKFGGSFLSEDGDDTIYDYLHGRYGHRLFLLHNHKYRDSAKLFERFFMKYIADEKLSMTFCHTGRMLWVLDEIDKIEGDFGLTQAVTLGRQFGLQVVVSTQSLESLYAIAPDFHGEHLTNAAMSGLGMYAVFHPGDAHTIQTLQTLFGKEQKQTMNMPLSRYDRPTITMEVRSIVEDSDFASLDVGECYVKIKSARPERVRIIPKKEV